MIEEQASPETERSAPDIRGMIREAIADVLREQQEAASQEQLAAERTQRETLEQRLNELIEENRRSRAKAEESERHSAIRAELERLGVAKVELAFRAVKDDIIRTEGGGLAARRGDTAEDLPNYLQRFLDENPELLPARMSGGSGQLQGSRAEKEMSRVDLDRIQPGMSAEELERVRQEIVRVANQAFRGM
jgi:hypothetical protein